jgi:hypothetical protein
LPRADSQLAALRFERWVLPLSSPAGAAILRYAVLDIGVPAHDRAATETAGLEIKAHPHMLRHACGYVAAKHKLPAVYYRRYFAASGGLTSYGYDILQEYRGMAGYVDRILKGEKPADFRCKHQTSTNW